MGERSSVVVSPTTSGGGSFHMGESNTLASSHKGHHQCLELCSRLAASAATEAVCQVLIPYELPHSAVTAIFTQSLGAAPCTAHLSELL